MSDREVQLVQGNEQSMPVTQRRPPIVLVRNLTKVYHLGETSVPALRGVSLTVGAGEFVAIMGPSGSGKTTFMNLLGCLDRPTSGDYWLVGRKVSQMTPDELADIRNRRIGFVFQGFHLLARSTALQNVALPLMYAGLSRAEQERRARRALELVGLGSRLHHRPSQLSGGQQQRVAIARALVNNPALLLADEPTGNLDSRTSIEIMAILQALNARGLTIVLVTHEVDIAAYARRRILFRDGQIVSDEPVTATRSAQEELLQFYQANPASSDGYRALPAEKER
nr:ABC transporter ATP-binding protein [Thermogemmatispora tikiterensis]